MTMRWMCLPNALASVRDVTLGTLIAWTVAVLVPTTARGQVVQLPTWRVFAVDTSVLVPDQGTTVLGGVNYSANSLVRRSAPLLPMPPFASAGRGQAAGTGQVSVSATIIDHEQWDRALLAKARSARNASTSPDPISQQARWMSQHVHQAASDVAGNLPVAQLRQQADRAVALHQTRQNADAQALLHHGDTCVQRREYAAARMFYRNALRQSHGEVLRQAQRRLASLELAQTQKTQRQPRPSP
jgi:hypothetical protein